jgi:uncharacterized cupredoxin-like copper-binding protein
MAHEFAVIKTARKADALLNGREADKKGDDVGEIENIQPGRSAKLTLTLPRGHYALICNPVTTCLTATPACSPTSP